MAVVIIITVAVSEDPTVAMEGPAISRSEEAMTMSDSHRGEEIPADLSHNKVRSMNPGARINQFVSLM
jgi:hypothetical protein